MALSAKQRLWLEEYLICRNATEAARRAGYRIPYRSGECNKRQPEIAAELERRYAEKAMQANEVLAGLADQARGDMGAFFKVIELWVDEPAPTQEVLDCNVDIDAQGRERRSYKVRQVVVDTERLRDPRYSRLIKRFVDSPKMGLVIELYDAQAALVTIGKQLGMFKENTEVDVGHALAAILEKLAGTNRPTNA